MKSSYRKEDVEILLKDITGLVEPLPAQVREARIQSGLHYCEMLPLEYRPSETYLETYQNALKKYTAATAFAVCKLAEKLYLKKGNSLTVVSLARAGIPIGILVKRYLKNKYKLSIDHYAISIIRGRGIDRNAVDFILQCHAPDSIQFVDGWIGKGAILTQLREALVDYPMLDAELGVLSDPAGLTNLCGTHEDILIPSSCLNATVTGLISRTFLREDVIRPGEFHGAVYYKELEEEDLSESFLAAIESRFVYDSVSLAGLGDALADSCIDDMMDLNNMNDKKSGIETVKRIAKAYGIKDMNLIKPGIGEATRVLLRRVPWKIIVNQYFAESDELNHIYQLAAEKAVPCEISRVPLGNYKVCGLIQQLADL